MPANFNLGEREMNIHVRNMSSENPADTPFEANNNIYKGDFVITDITKLPKEEVNILFQNLHCNYNLLLEVNPNNYVKDLTIRYKYNKSMECIYEVEPSNFKNFITESIQQEKPFYDISLNDLQIWHYLIVFAFALFFTIYLGVKFIDKKGLLVSKKSDD